MLFIAIFCSVLSFLFLKHRVTICILTCSFLMCFLTETILCVCCVDVIYVLCFVHVRLCFAALTYV